MKIGILGGTFDPIHEGHIQLALSAVQKLKLDKVLFIPTQTSPFKTEEKVSSAADRLAMVSLAIQEFQGFEVSDMEIKRAGISFTVDTLRELKASHPKDTQFFLIMGSDAFRDFDQWKEVEAVKEMCDLAVAHREGTELPSSEKVICISEELFPYSATQIRSSLARRRQPEGISDSVYQYIQKQGLYR